MAAVPGRCRQGLLAPQLRRAFPSAAIPQTTLKRYMALLETTFLVQMVPAWSGKLSKQLIKAPRVVLADTGLAAYLLGLNEQRLAHDATLAGPLLENFVGIEVKASSTVGASDFKGLKVLQETTGRRFHRGVVLYTAPRSCRSGRGCTPCP